MRTPIHQRVVAGVIAAGCLAVLIVAAAVPPSGAGHGTHEQLGLPQCGWVTAYDTPCPTCGMTTAFSHMAHQDVAGAFIAQPMGAVLALLTACVFWVGLHTAAFDGRSWLVIQRMFRPRLLWAVAIAWAGSWAYKIVTWQG